MSLVEHLGELRRRLVVALLAFGFGTVIGFYLAPDAIRILSSPVGGPLRFSQPGGALFTQLKVAMAIGLFLSAPVILYEFWAFVAPGLTSAERRSARPWIPIAFVLMVVGFGVAYLILPYTVAFLLGFAIPGTLEPLITVDAYFSFVTVMFLAFGLVMQFPIALVLLAKIGLVDAPRLRRGRRYVVVGLFVLAVVITPGGDPISPIVMSAVMYPMYELSIRLIDRANAKHLPAGRGNVTGNRGD